MSYYYSKKVSGDFDQVIEKVTAELKEQGFGVLTQIDFSGTIKKKLDVDLPKYIILGACNPAFAYQAYQKEKKIGVMLPCNVIVQQIDGGIEVSAVEPVTSMQGVGNQELEKVATEVQGKLRSAIDVL